MTVKPPPIGVLLPPTTRPAARTPSTKAPVPAATLAPTKEPSPAPLFSPLSSALSTKAPGGAFVVRCEAAPLSMSPRLPLISVDAKTTPMSPTALSTMLSTTASQAHLAVIEQKGDPRSKHALAAGVLSTQGFFRVASFAQFGDRAGRPISYAAFRQSLKDHGLQTEWRTMLDVMPAALRAKHLAGKASPNELYDAWANDRATWRASVEPMALEVLKAELTREGRGAELAQAFNIMTPGQRARLEAGVMRPPEISDLLQDAKTRQADVIIVGAGMAGLAAAQDLMAKGLSVVVLEASAHIGGRTKNASVGDIAFDQGAAWIHATDENPLTPIVKQLGLTTTSNGAPSLAYGGTSSPAKEGEKITAALEDLQEKLGALATRGKDVSAATIEAPHTPHAHIAKNTIGPLTMGVEWRDVSTLDVGSQPGENHGATAQGTPDLFVKEGLQTVTQSFMHGVPVRLQTPVSKVQWGSGGVTVEAGGVRFSGKKLLMTASVGVLGSGKIGFDPPLPDWKKEAIDKVPMATFDKIALRFDQDIFSKHGVQPGAFVYELDDPDAMDVVVRPTGQNVVVGLIGGAFADTLHKEGKDKAVERLVQKLERLYGPEVRQHLTAAAVTNWRADPFHLGSFTATRPGYAKMREKLRLPVADTLFFAGEAQSMRWGGMLPGAYLTGKQAGGEITAALSTSSQQQLQRHKAKLAAPAPQASA
jgi:monoamine oxidase